MSGMKSRRKLLLAVAILAAVLVLGLLLKGMDAGRPEASGSAEEDLSSETAQLLANAGGTFSEENPLLHSVGFDAQAQQARSLYNEFLT